MKIGIIVHSQTGNTHQIGEKLLEKLQNYGHETTLLRIQNLKSEDTSKKTNDLVLDSVPEAKGYDALIFGAWVEAFNLCPGFTLYLKQLSSIDTKNVSCFVTHHFPFKWMGGSNGLNKMKKLLADKGIKTHTSGVVDWSNKKREQQIEDLVTRITEQFAVL